MSIVLLGSTSGSCTLQEQAIAGNTTLTLPTTSGTLQLAPTNGKWGLGITGEVWNNLTGTRSANQTYTNERTYPIMVTIMMHTGSSGSNPSYIYVDGVVVNQSSSFGWTGGTDFTCTTIVPSGKTYSTNSTSAGSLWVELY